MNDPWADHLLRIYRFAMHLCGDQHLAEDLAQEAMLRAVRSCGQLREPLAIRVWLLRVVENLWRDWCRKNGRKAHEPIDTEEVAHAGPEPLDTLVMAEEVASSVEAMRRLPERQRAVLHLVACQELSILETAEVLQITPQAVRSNLSVARLQMRRMVIAGRTSTETK